MKTYNINIVLSNSNDLTEIINDLSKYECAIHIDKNISSNNYTQGFSEYSYQKLGEGCKSENEYMADMDFYKNTSKLLQEYGLSPKHKGFSYAIECIRLMNTYGMDIYTMDSDVYPVISKLYNVAPSSIEHNIRNAINNSWNNHRESTENDDNKIKEFNKKPTNIKFLKHISELIKYSSIDVS